MTDHSVVSFTCVPAIWQLLIAFDYLPALFRVAAIQEATAVGVATSYLTGVLVYVLSAYLPQRERQLAIEPEVARLIEAVQMHLMFFVVAATGQEVNQMQIRFGSVSQEDVQRAMEKLKYGSPHRHNVQTRTVGAAGARAVEHLCENVESLRTYIPLLDPELVELVNAAARHRINDIWLSSHGQMDRGVANFAPDVYEHYQNYVSIRGYTQRRMGTNSYLRYRRAAELAVHLDQPAEAAKLLERNLEGGQMSLTQRRQTLQLLRDCYFRTGRMHDARRMIELTIPLAFPGEQMVESARSELAQLGATTGEIEAVTAGLD